jgi:uncharacterized protein DUF4149
MLALRYVSLLALTLWLGGLIVLGAIAAPSIFQVVDAEHAAGGRLLAGAIFGDALRRFHHLSYACGGVILAGFIARAVLGPRPLRLAIRMVIALAMLGAAAYSGVVISGRIAQIQSQIRVAPSSLPEQDPRRVEFDRLHRRSTSIQIVPLVGGLILLFWELKE